MEERNAALQESSGYNVCMVRIKASAKKVDDCRLAKVQAAGFDSWRDCVQKGMDDGLCSENDNARYKAEVRAYNECMAEDTETLTEGDCRQMLMDAMVQ